MLHIHEEAVRIIDDLVLGCHLCRLVCPTGAIGVSRRFSKKEWS